MNTRDVEVPEEVRMSKEDRLTAIFNMQRELMQQYGKIEKLNGFYYPFPDGCPVNIDDRRGQQLLKDMAWRVTEELGEAMNCLKNKPWKQTHMLTDNDHFDEEIADAFHFFIELCIWAGIDEDTLFDLYFKKNQVNRFRQRSKY